MNTSEPTPTNITHPENAVLTQQAPPVIFTVGHSTRTLADFVALLQANDIQLLVDIRTIPRSRHNPQFNSDTLGEALAGYGISYLHLKGLGGLRHARADSPNTGWRNASFRGYADYLQTPAFAEALDNLIELARLQTVAIMCAEAVPWRCHRSLVADALTIRGIIVRDIISRESAKPHRLSPLARVEGLLLTYPPPE